MSVNDNLTLEEIIVDRLCAGEETPEKIGETPEKIG